MQQCLNDSPRPISQLPRTPRPSSAWLGLIAIACLSAGGVSGCGSKQDGPPRYGLSGKITYQGQPVPVGELRFSPDTKNGNSGPGAIAKIKDGEYETYAGKGTVGGPMLIYFTGFDGKPVKVGEEFLDDGMPLFDPFEIEVELPQNNSTWDYEVTAPPSKLRATN